MDWFKLGRGSFTDNGAIREDSDFKCRLPSSEQLVSTVNERALVLHRREAHLVDLGRVIVDADSERFSKVSRH